MLKITTELFFLSPVLRAVARLTQGVLLAADTRHTREKTQSAKTLSQTPPVSETVSHGPFKLLVLLPTGH